MFAGLPSWTNGYLHYTGVRIIGPVGIGEVQMTTFFYGTKSLLKMSFRIKKIKLDGDLTEDKEKCLGPPLS